MRKLAILTALAVGSAGLSVAALPAGAATSRGEGNESFCETLLEVGQDAGGTGTAGAFDTEAADAVADSLRAAAKFAPKKVKKAMRRMAKVYSNIEEDDDFAAAFANQRFLRDSITYSQYYVEQCTTITIPTLEP